nr:hypothetical protein GCM10020185_73230 [Pseudomonas brassicacearum subsp. brassicacearum]
MTLPRALAFDVFGTVVDWHSGIAREASTFVSTYLPAVSPAEFAMQWRRLYAPALRECIKGHGGFVVLDTLHYETLVQLLTTYGLEVDQLAPEALHTLAHAWRRLDPWPDVAEGLAPAAPALCGGDLVQCQCGLDDRHEPLQRFAVGRATGGRSSRKPTNRILPPTCPRQGRWISNPMNSAWWPATTAISRQPGIAG